VSQALYRKYRSKTLAEVVGQEHVTDILSRSLKVGRVAHAYLLTGPRGVGKTSIARILAHEINQLPYTDETNHLDIIEIDAASNNGVEDVRDLRDKVQITPVSAKYKVYIIDEVHMLSKAAFNALLKTLEEPPAHAVFILATTDVDKLPATIISRTQRFSFRSIGRETAVKHLRYIADQEKITITDGALELIALHGDGSFRDSISLLDQLSGLSDTKEGVTEALIENALGLAPTKRVADLLSAYEHKDLAQIVSLLDTSERDGIQVTVLAHQLIQTLRQEVAAKPQFIELLDNLLDVNKSSQPHIKLLTVLGSHAVPKPKSAALSVPTHEVSATVPELEQLAAKPHPELVPRPAPAKQVAAPAKAARAPKPTAATQPAPASIDALPTGPISIDKFDWTELVEYARQHYVAVYSVLSKCGYEIEGEKLVLYTMNAFYKKKLDDMKHRVNLSKALIETGVGNIEIETIGTPPPPKDSQAAAVAAIMGGGEEVSVA
jgi:DNA polymerase-3 subunit gamma/tau